MAYLTEAERRREAVTAFDMLAQDIANATPSVEPDRQPYDEPGPFYNLAASRRLSSSRKRNVIKAISSSEPFLALIRTGVVVEIPARIDIKGRKNPVKSLDPNRPIVPREILWHEPESSLLFKATRTRPNLVRDPQSVATVTVATFSLPSLEIERSLSLQTVSTQHLEWLETARDLFNEIIQRHVEYRAT